MLRTFSTFCSFPSPNFDKIFPSLEKKCKGKGPSFLSLSTFLYQNPCFSYFHLHFFPPSTIENPPSTLETSSINTPHSHEVSYSLHIYFLASSPRIHMDSWWAARNPNQGPKWTQNIAEDRSGAYGPKSCRIWAPKSPKSVLYISWLNESAEPVSNRSIGLKKIEILTEYSLKNKESKKKEKRTRF